MVTKLFVYGTLGPGRPNEHMLSDIGGNWSDATVTGNLHQKGWGAEMGYPGIVIAKDGKKVNGFIFSSKNLANSWAQLDEFEGEAYERLIVEAELKNGKCVDVYVYALKI